MMNLFKRILKPVKGFKLPLNGLLAILLMSSVESVIASNAEFTIAEVQPVQVSREQREDHVQMSFSAFGQTFNLVMQNNEALMKNYSSRFLDVNLYSGVIEGVAGSWARITIANGKLSGAVYDGYELYMLDEGAMVAESVDVRLKEVMQQTDNVVYRASDLTSTLSCGAHGNDGVASKFSYQELVSDLKQQTAVDGQGENSGVTEVTASATATQQVNLNIVADTQYVATSPNGAEVQVLSQMNIVDGIFSEQVGVQFGINDIQVLSNNGPLTSTNSSTLLNQYRSFVGNNNPGLSHLFTGREVDGNVIGIAFVSGICTSSGVGVTQAGGRGTFGALTAAHEFGHNFGSPHDNQAGSACASTPGTFLMNPSINGSDQFSQCSLQQIENVLSARSCLVDVDPPAPTPTPITDCNSDTSFSNGASGFTFVDDPQTPAYTDSSISGGSVNIVVGGVDDADISNMEAAWSRQCQSDSAGQVAISVNGILTQSSEYESNELSQIALRVNGNRTVLATLTGDGNGGPTLSTGTQEFTTQVTLAGGINTIELLCFNNLKTFNNEVSNCSFTNIDVSTPASSSVLDENFNSSFGGFSFEDDVSDPLYSDGSRTDNGGVANSGALVTTLGGVDNADINDMEGAWTRSFTVLQAGQLTLSLDGNLVQTEGYEPNESSEIGIMIDDRSLVLNSVVGDGNGGGPIGTGFQRYTINFDISAGNHSVTLFCRNSGKTVVGESTDCLFDNVVIE